MGLPGDEIQRAGSGGAESGAERIVAHREVLCVVPNRGHGIAVVVTHHDAGPFAGRVAAPAGRSHGLDKLVHEAGIESFLLVVVIVILVAGHRLCSRQPEGLNRIGIVREQRAVQSIHRRRIRRGVKCRLGRGVIGRHGIRGKVMIKRHIFLEDDDDMLNRCGRIGVRQGRDSAQSGEPNGKRECQLPVANTKRV